MKTKTIKSIPIPKTEKDALKYVKKYPWKLLDIPEEFITEEICLIGIKGTKYTFRCLDKKFMTEEICIEAIRNDEEAIKYIPNRLLTEKLKLLHEAIWEL